MVDILADYIGFDPDHPPSLELTERYNVEELLAIARNATVFWPSEQHFLRAILVDIVGAKESRQAYVDKHVRYVPNSTFAEGRLYPEKVDGIAVPSLAGKWGVLCKSLTGNTEFDIDAVTCAQTILFDTACHFGFDDQLPIMKSYTPPADKDAFFDKFLRDHPNFSYRTEVKEGPNAGQIIVESGKKGAKSLHHAVVFGGNYKLHTNSRSGYLEDLQKEALTLWRCLDETFRDSALWKRWKVECNEKATREDKRPFYQGCLSARLFQSKEVRAVVAAITWFRFISFRMHFSILGERVWNERCARRGALCCILFLPNPQSLFLRTPHWMITS